MVWVVKQGKFNNGNKFVGYHPTDFTQVQKRLASLLYLLNLNIYYDDVNNAWRVPLTDKSYETIDGNVSTDSVVNAVVSSVSDGAVLITTTKYDNNGNTECHVTLPDGFATNPFDYVEFLDNSYLNIDVTVASRTVDELLIDQTAVNSDLYALLSKWFVNVYHPFNYGTNYDKSGNPVKQGNLQLNGQDRFTAREGDYFNYVQPWQTHTNTPADGINVYSFALNPEEHQPSGTCNFSRIDFSQLNFTLNNKASDNSTFCVYTVNYNILRIMGNRKFCPEKHSANFIRALELENPVDCSRYANKTFVYPTSASVVCA